MARLCQYQCSSTSSTRWEPSIIQDRWMVSNTTIIQSRLTLARRSITIAKKRQKWTAKDQWCLRSPIINSRMVTRVGTPEGRRRRAQGSTLLHLRTLSLETISTLKSLKSKTSKTSWCSKTHQFQGCSRIPLANLPLQTSKWLKTTSVTRYVMSQCLLLRPR